MEASDIFANVGSFTAAEVVVASKKDVPIGYIPVKFSSKDKLSPPVLHFRNYSMSELLEIASSNDETQFEILIYRVLNAMCFEKYDCAKLHIEQIKEIVLTVYANFWDNKLIHKPYYIDITREDIDNKDNIAYTDIPLQRLNIIDINDDFKFPFTIEDNKTKKRVKFTFPSCEHVFLAEQYVKDMFKDEEQKFMRLRSILNTVAKLNTKGDAEAASKIIYDVQEKEELEMYEHNRSKMYLKVLQCQLLVAVDNKELTTLKDKYDAFCTDVDATTWMRYTKHVEKSGKFGIDSNYTFKHNDTEITRRFSFRLVDFIPAMEQETDTGYTILSDA